MRRSESVAGEPPPAAHGESAADQPRPTSEKPPRTRLSRTFSGLVAGAVVLILLLIFILQNTETVKISYLGANGHLSLGVALLLAAVGGALLAGLLGAARIAQLRRHARRHPPTARQ